jgi:fructose/tagatose bisphosphate aldolase
MIFTDRKDSEKIIERIKSQNVCLPIFCTASHWNTEAILMAAKNVGEKYNVKDVPVAIAMTYNYEYMPQAQRITFTKDARLGFLSIMHHLRVIANDSKSPYYNVLVLPHLDHADPIKDKWALTEGTDYIASVMFDAQKYPLEDNLKMTSDYVSKYKKKVMIEGIMDELNVSVGREKQKIIYDNYPERAIDYMKKTGIDFLVADLGTEQQSNSVGQSVYLKKRARDIYQIAEDKVLVLHGTSCLSQEEIATLPEDGILRVNMWTRIARDSGLYAIDQLHIREDKIRKNEFNAIESHQYLMDSTEKAAQIMEEIMISLGYDHLI